MAGNKEGIGTYDGDLRKRHILKLKGHFKWENKKELEIVFIGRDGKLICSKEQYFYKYMFKLFCNDWRMSTEISKQLIYLMTKQEATTT